MQKVNSFSEFINEASLRGNAGIPGEEGSDRESWLDKITQRSNQSAQEFAMANRADIQGFMELVRKSQELQSGHEEELSELTVDAFRKLYGSLIEEFELDFKIVTREEVKQEMDETPDEKEEDPELDALEDQEIIDHIQVRKIQRTIQQGKGLSAKSILNLSIFKNGLVQILGQEDAAEYLRVLNKISNVAQFFDWTVPEERQKSMWRTREGFSGSCDIQFGEEKETKEENKEDIAKKVLDDLENGEDIIDNENAEDLVSGLNVKIVSRGVDLSVLIHESIKGIYKLITQASLEALYGGTAETVLMNTDTLFDELQEIKFGRQMQDVFFKQVSQHPLVEEKIGEMMDEEDWVVASFQERINYLFFNAISQLGQLEPRDMLKLVNAILTESPEATELCDPLIRGAIKHLEQEEEFQNFKRNPGQIANISAPKISDEPRTTEDPEDLSGLSKNELNDMIIDAYSRKDMKEVDRLRKFLGEALNLKHFIGRIRLNS